MWTRSVPGAFANGVVTGAVVVDGQRNLPIVDGDRDLGCSCIGVFQYVRQRFLRYSEHREADACRNVFGRAGHRERCLEWWFAEAVDQLDEIGETRRRRRRRSIGAPQHAEQPVEFIEG